MKKKVLATVGTLTAAAIIGLGFSQSGVVSADPNFTALDIREKVNKQYPGEIIELELDKQTGNPVYEVEIKMNGKEYELAIDGDTGDILKLDEKMVAQKATEQKELDKQKELEITKEEQEKSQLAIKEKENSDVNVEMGEEKKSEKVLKTPSIDDDADDKDVKQESKSNKREENKTQNNNKGDKKEESKESNKKAVIGKDKAKQIALGQFNGHVEEIELDDDDGRLIYEVEIENSNGEAEIEIDAYTGKVIVVDIDMEDDDDD